MSDEQKSDEQKSDETTKPAAPAPQPIDILELLKESLPEAHAVTVAQAHLQGQLDQAMVDAIPRTQGLGTVADLLGKLVAAAEQIKPALGSIPEPWRTVISDAIEAAEIADRALGAFGL